MGRGLAPAQQVVRSGRALTWHRMLPMPATPHYPDARHRRRRRPAQSPSHLHRLRQAIHAGRTRFSGTETPCHPGKSPAQANRVGLPSRHRLPYESQRMRATSPQPKKALLSPRSLRWRCSRTQAPPTGRYTRRPVGGMAVRYPPLSELTISRKPITIPTRSMMSAVLDAFLAPSTLPAFQRLVTCAEKYIPIPPMMKEQRNAMIESTQYVDGFAVMAAWAG